MGSPTGGVSRRGLLGTIASISLATTAGCLDRFDPVQDTDTNGELAAALELAVLAPPSDEDPAATEIARRMVDHLTAVGVDATFFPRLRPQLYADVHLEGSYDLFVSPTPRLTDPDDLRPMLHSHFAAGIGEWLNPFGLVDDDIDELLAEQRRAIGADRQDALDGLQAAIASETVPFTVVTAPDELTAVAASLEQVNRPPGFDSPGDIFTTASPVAENPLTHLRVGLLDGQVTQQLNPLTGQFVGHPVVTGLLYDSLLRRIDGNTYPWAAEEIAWVLNADPPEALVRLRPELTWHDGEPFDEDDVRFTFGFLEDLAGGEVEDPWPAALFTSHISLVESVEQTSEGYLRFVFDDVSRPLAERALTVPILPEHEWADLAGLDDEGIPRPLTVQNLDPVGSGPFELATLVEGERLVLERDEDHFTVTQEHEMGSMTAIETITMVVPTHPPSVANGVNLIADDQLDIVPKIPPEGVSTVVRADEVELDIRPSSRRYVVGFNTARRPCDDPHLRRVLARMIDRTFTAASVFRGYAQPADTPLARTPYQSASLEWSGQSVLGPFPGSGGVIDPEAARELFEGAGYPFEEDVGILDGQA